MIPKTHLLALFTASLKNPDQTAGFKAEHGAPGVITGMVYGRSEDGITVKLVKVGGPKNDGDTETISAAILDKTEGAEQLLVVMQKPAANLADITTDELGQIGGSVYEFIVDDGDTLATAAKADPELDDKMVVVNFIKVDDAFVPTEMTARLQDFAVDYDGDIVLILADDELAILQLGQLRANLADSGKLASHGALQVKQVEMGAKLAVRPTEIEIGDETKRVWAYTAKNGDGEPTIFYLDCGNLELLAMQPFKGTYATPSVDGSEMIFISHSPAGEDIDVQPEKFEIVRGPFAAQPVVAAPEATQ